MPRTCSICTHDQRAEIDRTLVAGATSNRRIASQHDVSERAIRDHKANHLKVRMLKAVERREEADIRTAIDVVGQLKAINGAALTVLKDARDAGDGDLARELLLVQYSAYAVEAVVIQDDRIPPLHETLKDLRRAPLLWLGAFDDCLVGAVACEEGAEAFDIDR